LKETKRKFGKLSFLFIGLKAKKKLFSALLIPPADKPVFVSGIPHQPSLMVVEKGTTTLIIIGLFAIFRRDNQQNSIACHYAECRSAHKKPTLACVGSWRSSQTQG